MLTRFAIDPDALMLASDGEHRRLLREWSRYGVLVHDGTTFAESELGCVVLQLSQSALTLWKQVLKQAWLKAGSSSWTGLHNLENHLDNLSQFDSAVDLLCLEETRLAVLREPIETESPRLELTELKDIDTSRAFEHSHEFSEKRTDGLKISDLWKKRFALPASLAKNITIVDRFALADGEGINGLEAFLILLDGVGSKTNITIFSSFGDQKLSLSEIDAQNRMAFIRQRMARGGVDEIKLFLTDSRSFGRVEHDRFLRFDHLVFEIGSGMAIFNGRQSKQSTFSSKLQQSGHKNTLAQLRKLSSASYPVFV